MVLNLIWSDEAIKHLEFFKRDNPKLGNRIQQLIQNIQQTPYAGIGKPEPLKHRMTGLWSRRIDQKHRLIYSVNQTMNIIEIVSCKGHY